MDQSSSVNRWHLAILVTLTIGMILCLAWTPAYGYGISSAELATGISGAPGGNPPQTGTPVWHQNTATAPTTSWTFDYDAEPLTCPPPVPEPTTLILIGLGLAGGAAMKRFRG